MISSGVLSLKDDWTLSGVVLSKHPRSAESFAHRYAWLLYKVFDTYHRIRKVMVPPKVTPPCNTSLKIFPLFTLGK